MLPCASNEADAVPYHCQQISALTALLVMVA